MMYLLENEESLPGSNGCPSCRKKLDFVSFSIFTTKTFFSINNVLHHLPEEKTSKSLFLRRTNPFGYAVKITRGHFVHTFFSLPCFFPGTKAAEKKKTEVIGRARENKRRSCFIIRPLHAMSRRGSKEKLKMPPP